MRNPRTARAAASHRPGAWRKRCAPGSASRAPGPRPLSTSGMQNMVDIETTRLRNEGPKWQAWGPYLSERQWGTVREDYSAHGNAWDYLPHDHARSRAYRWGEDGIAGWSDAQQRLCFSVALWNGHDAILKERL